MGEANRCYLVLKQDYEVRLEEIEALKEDVRGGKSVVDNLKRHISKKEVESLTIISQLNSDIASANADIANNTAAVSLMEERENLLKSRLKESKEQCTATHMSLAAVVREKEH